MGMDISILNQDVISSDMVSLNKLNSKIEILKNVSGLTEKVENKKLKEACQGFEAIFIKNMLKNMRNSLPGEPLFETENHGMNIYKSMHDEYLSEALSKQGQGIGISEFLYNELRDKAVVKKGF